MRSVAIILVGLAIARRATSRPTPRDASREALWAALRDTSPVITPQSPLDQISTTPSRTTNPV